MGRPGSVSGADDSFVFKYCLSAVAAGVAETGMNVFVGMLGLN